MKYAWEFVKNTVVGGLLIVVPISLAVLLLLKAMQSVMGLVRPLSKLLPAWLPADNILSLLLVLSLCFLIGLPSAPPWGERCGSVWSSRCSHASLATPSCGV